MDQVAKILRHHWKGRLNISKLAKFESDRSKASQDIAKIYRRLYRVGGKGGGGKFVTPDHTNVCKISRLLGAIYYVTFQPITFKIGNFTNLKTLFPAESTDFPWLADEKSWKKRWKVYSPVLLSCPWLFEYKSLSRTSLQISKCSVIIVNFINSLTRHWFLFLLLLDASTGWEWGLSL